LPICTIAIVEIVFRTSFCAVLDCLYGAPCELGVADAREADRVRAGPRRLFEGGERVGRASTCADGEHDVRRANI